MTVSGLKARNPWRIGPMPCAEWVPRTSGRSAAGVGAEGQACARRGNVRQALASSGGQSRRASKAAKVWPGACRLIGHCRPGCLRLKENKHHHRQHGAAIEASIRDHMPDRLVRMVLRNRTILVVMVRLLLPMKRSVRECCRVARGYELASDRHRLPEG